MGSLDTVKVTRLVKLLASYGFYERRQKGSHRIFKKEGVKGSFTIASHDKEVAGYVVKQVINRLNMSQEEFLKVLKKF